MSDLTFLLLRHGYDAVDHDRSSRGGGTTYESRLLGHRAVVLGDAAGARLFYDEGVVERSGVVPPPLAWLLFGRGAVHGLDDEEHARRKELMVAAVHSLDLDALAQDVRQRVGVRLAVVPGGRVVAFDALVTAYGGAVLHGAGIDLPTEESHRWSRRMAAVVDGFGFSPAAYARGCRERARLDRWAAALVCDARAGRTRTPRGGVLDVLAGSDLDHRTAGIELLNVLRPTVAVAWLGAFALLALDAAPEWRERLADPAGEEERLAFAQEVRRTTPFVPLLAGRARRAASHDGVPVEPGDRVVLDVLGIDRDPMVYPHPHLFRPARFLGRTPSAYDLVPQGGGPLRGHRCPGEDVALRLMSSTLRAASQRPLEVVSSRAVAASRVPTLPAGGLVLARQR